MTNQPKLAHEPTGSKPTNSGTKIESTAIYIALISGAVSFLVSLALFWGDQVSLFTKGLSIGFVASIGASVVTLVTYLMASLGKATEKPKGRLGKTKRYIGIWSLALVHTLLSLLIFALMFYVVDQSFIGATVDHWAASTITAFGVGVAGYITYISAATMSSMRVATILALFLVSGTFVSMMTAHDPHWWYVHFSSLGAGGGVSGYAFNGTLIIAGLAMLGLTDYITKDFQELRARNDGETRIKARTLSFGIAGIGIMLALVGAFVYNAFPAIHNSAAGGMAVLFLFTVLALPWLAPDFPKAFFVASYGLFAALLVGVWLYQVGYFNLTVFELAAAAIIFTWLIIFVRNTAAMLDDRQAKQS